MQWALIEWKQHANGFLPRRCALHPQTGRAAVFAAENTPQWATDGSLTGRHSQQWRETVFYFLFFCQFFFSQLILLDQSIHSLALQHSQHPGTRSGDNVLTGRCYSNLEETNRLEDELQQSLMLPARSHFLLFRCWFLIMQFFNAWFLILNVGSCS